MDFTLPEELQMLKNNLRRYVDKVSDYYGVPIPYNYPAFGRDAFRTAVASDEFRQACDKIDAPVLYLDGPEYERYVLETYKRETVLIERLKLKELLKS